MNTIKWLLEGDPIIQRLTKIYLLDQKVSFVESGLIKKYLSLYVSKEQGWGHGLYSPKWISDHYTLLELRYMEIDPHNFIYQQSVQKLIEGMWYKGPKKKGYKRHQDMCVSGMMLGLASYGKLTDYRVFEMVDYILDHVMPDGGWNCGWEGEKKTIKSSLHTTISVLEAFADYVNNGYTYRIEEVKKAIKPAEEFLLKKQLFRSVTTGKIIHNFFINFHYPLRWRYDAFRALEYFCNVRHPYDPRMKEAFDILRNKLNNGFLGKGSQYSGLIHFKLETTKGGRFNTFRALKILKYYDVTLFEKIINTDWPKLD